MMRYLLPSAGIALMLLPATATAKPLYETIRGTVQWEYDSPQETVKAFLAKAFVANPSLSPDDIATSNDSTSFRSSVCSSRKLDDESCEQLRKEIRAAVLREERVRALGRDLQLIAGGYEMPIGDHPSRILSIFPKFQSIVRVWQSSNDWLSTPIAERRMRAGPAFTDLAKSELKTLQEHLDKLNDNDSNQPEHLTAAVWRYQFGLFGLVNREGTCDPAMEKGDGTELQYQHARWCTIEEDLQKIFQKVRASLTFDPPLGFGEIVLLPPWRSDKGIILWMFASKNPFEEDIGLEWELPVEPILPSLDCSASTPAEGNTVCIRQGIFGGTYPLPPSEPSSTDTLGAELCALPFSAEGYLCRPLDTQRCPANESSSSSSSLSEEKKNAISLTHCNSQNIAAGFRVAHTESGPNACMIGGWRSDPPLIDNKPVKDTTKRDEKITTPFDCGNCAVDIYCNGAGEPEQNCSEDYAVTYPKDRNGVIPICLPAGGESANVTYLLLHELIHAQQWCEGASTYSNLKDCCATEKPAYLAQCNAIAEDGNFAGTDITIEHCANILVNFSCERFGGFCTKGTPANATEREQWLQELQNETKKIFEASKQNIAGLPTKCEDVVNNMDARVRSIINSLPHACSPACKARYENTIGNNVCYVAQCIEMSLENQRILPGRMTFTGGDEAFPWDAKTAADPLIGDVLTIPPLPETSFPAYRPAQLAADLDLALCQQNGQPLLFPPSRCDFNTNKQLGLAPESYFQLGFGITDQVAQRAESTLGLRTLGQAVGRRIGARLLADYLTHAGEAFRELIGDANLLTGKIGKIKFPKEMCPRYNGS